MSGWRPAYSTMTPMTIFSTNTSPQYAGTEVDAIVLGCTHYPFIRGAFARNAKRYLRGDCALIDGSVGTVRQLERILDMYKLKNPCGTGTVEFHTSGNEAVLKPIFEKLLKQDKI